MCIYVCFSKKIKLDIKRHLAIAQTLGEFHIYICMYIFVTSACLHYYVPVCVKGSL